MIQHVALGWQRKPFWGELIGRVNPLCWSNKKASGKPRIETFPSILVEIRRPIHIPKRPLIVDVDPYQRVAMLSDD